jgi:hypothetical protein
MLNKHKIFNVRSSWHLLKPSIFATHNAQSATHAFFTALNAYLTWHDLLSHSLLRLLQWNSKDCFLLILSGSPFWNTGSGFHLIRIDHRPFIIEHQVVQEHNHFSACKLHAKTYLWPTSKWHVSEQWRSQSFKPIRIKSFWIWEMLWWRVWAPKMPK